MKTSMNLPDQLIHEAMRVCHSRVMSRTVVLALEELIRKKKAERLLELAGKLRFADDREMERIRDDR